MELSRELLSDSLWRLENLYWIVNRRGESCLFRLNGCQRELLDGLWYKNLILKARQLGFTTLIQLWMLDQCLFRENFRAGVVAHTREDARIFFQDKIKYAYDNLPEVIRCDMPLLKSTSFELKFPNGSSIRVGTSLRGGTYNALHISEFGISCVKYPEKALEVVNGTLNTVAPDQFVFIESTGMGRGTKFQEMCNVAERMRLGGHRLTSMDYRFFFFPWWRGDSYVSDGAVVFSDEDLGYFGELSGEGIELSDRQRAWYVKKKVEQGEGMLSEYPSTSGEAFESQLSGAVFGIQMRRCREEGRIGEVPHSGGVPVNVFWDLGHSDMTSLWFHQQVGVVSHFVDYYENRQVDLVHYIEVLKRFSEERGYVYGAMYLPHDGRSRRVDSVAGSAEEILRGHGFRVLVVNRPAVKFRSIEDTRRKFGMCWFDEGRCRLGIKCLDEYVWRDDESMRIPKHNWASNGADAFQVFGFGYRGDSPWFVGSVGGSVHPLYRGGNRRRL